MHELIETQAELDPLRQFRSWYEAAQAAELPDVEAFTLATVTADGQPTARVVLLRGFDEHGFAFFTNYLSNKSQELAANPRACLLVYWAEMYRQVRIEGCVEKVSPEESEAYFRSRPRGHQLSAWASVQSQVLASRLVLEERMREVEQRYQDQEVPRPDHWGGYRLVPTLLEFWQGRDNRLHDRLCYRLVNGTWVRQRLSP